MTNAERILTLLESFRSKKQVQTFLELRGLTYSGTWKTVKDKVEDAVEAGSITVKELADLLESVEEHGDQYVFLYDFSPQAAVRIADRKHFEDLLTRSERQSTLDKVSIVANPSESPTLVSAVYSQPTTLYRTRPAEAIFEPERTPEVSPSEISAVKLKWVQKRSFRKPLGESVSGQIATVTYQIISTRAVDIAILDLKERRAALCIQKIEPGVRNYGKELRSLLARLSRFVDVDVNPAFVPLDLKPVMRAISDKRFGEVRRRRYRSLDGSGVVVDVTSATEATDIYTGGLYEAGRDHYAGAISGLNANVYWNKVPRYLDREIHTIFPYKQAQNAVIFMQRCTPVERNYVLSRIQTIASGKP